MIVIDDIESPRLSTLPDKPSDLLELALLELIKCENTPGVAINMSYWYYQQEDTCEVCLAGAVMRNILWPLSAMYEKEVEVTPDNYNKDTYSKLKALNEFRIGNVSQALGWMNLPTPALLQNYIVISSYEYKPYQFKQDIRSLIELLQSHNL